MNGPIADNNALTALFSKDPRTRQIETDFLRRLDGWICSRPDDSEVLLSLLDLLNHLAPNGHRERSETAAAAFQCAGRQRH